PSSSLLGKAPTAGSGRMLTRCTNSRGPSRTRRPPPRPSCRGPSPPPPDARLRISPCTVTGRLVASHTSTRPGSARRSRGPARTAGRLPTPASARRDEQLPGPWQDPVATPGYFALQLTVEVVPHRLAADLHAGASQVVDVVTVQVGAGPQGPGEAPPGSRSDSSDHDHVQPAVVGPGHRAQRGAAPNRRTVGDPHHQ